MKKLSMVLAAAALTAVSTVAQAQAGTCGPDGSGNLSIGTTVCAPTHTLSTTVNDILLLTVSTGSTALNNPTSVNYGALASNGYLSSATPLAAAGGPNVKVVANRAFEVSITATSASFGPVGVNKPTSDVQWKTGAVGSVFAALATTAGATTTVLTKTTGTVDTNETLAFQSRWAFERDIPGSYSTTVTLTLAAK